MTTNTLVVRVLKPEDRPFLPKKKKVLVKSKPFFFFLKPLNIIIGSGIGFAAGLVIYLMLKATGLDLGGLESSVIIGFPSLLGVLTSLVIF